MPPAGPCLWRLIFFLHFGTLAGLILFSYSLPAQEASVLQSLDIRQVPQRLHAESREEVFRRHIAIGRAGRRAARPGADEPGAAESRNRVAADLLSKNL